MMVVFSGGGTAGHFHPARNMAEALAGQVPGIRPYFVGTEGRIEAAELPGLGYPYLLLPVEGLRSPPGALRGAGRGVGRLRGLVSATAANARALWLLARAVARLVPDFQKRGVAGVVVTGGYVSAPAGIAGWLLGLPVVVQEQNRHPGKTTRLVARWARQIHLAYPEAATALPNRARRRVVHSGNPIRPLPPLEERDRKTARRDLGLPASGSVILVVGGSQGARKMNRATIEILQDDMPDEREFVLWVTGRAHFAAARATVGARAGDRFAIVPYLEPDRMYRALSAADLAISRAGAMATSEFLAWGLPAILVPLPTAAAGHQAANARALEEAGAAVHLPERDESGAELRGARLWSEVRRLLDTPGLLSAMSEAARSRARPDAAREAAAAIAALLCRHAAGAPS